MAANTVAWQNRYDTNHKGERLYDFGQDLINAMAEYVDEAKDTSAMKKYLDAKAKKLTKEKEAQKPEYKNNPAFGDPSHHSNRKNRKEAFSDWRSDFIWEDGDSVKKI